MSDGTPERMRDLVAGYWLGAPTPEESRGFEAALVTRFLVGFLAGTR